jgi:hypothetical protein
VGYGGLRAEEILSFALISFVLIPFVVLSPSSDSIAGCSKVYDVKFSEVSQEIFGLLVHSKP